MNSRLLSCVIIFLLGAISASAYAQADTTTATESVPWIRVGGTILVTGDYYGINSSVDSNGIPVWPARRPANLYRVVATPTITLFDKVVLPFHLSIASRETNTLSPSTLSPTLWQIFTNPLNSLGVTFQPGVDWLTIDLGSHTPHYSELAGSETQIFGAGFQMNPGLFRLAVNVGLSQRAISPDPTNNIYGAYQRMTYMAKIGIGTEQGGYVDLNFVRIHDDTTDFIGKPKPYTTGIIFTPAGNDSLGFPIFNSTYGNVDRLAEDGMLTSLKISVPIIPQIIFVTEGAFSAVTRDESLKGIDSLPFKIPSFLFRANPSSHGDIAGLASFNFHFQDWGVETKAKYVGPGYVQLGYPFTQNDYLDLTLSPTIRFLQGNVMLSGTLGTRTDNLALDVSEHTTQIIAAGNLNVIIKNFSVAFGYSNFGYRNNVTNDTLRIQSVSKSISVTPSYTIFGTSVTHSITIGASIDTYQDYNVISSTLTNNNTFSMFGFYNASFSLIPLSLSLGSNYLKNDLPIYGYSMIGGSVDGSYRLFNDKLIPSLGLVYNRNTPTIQTSDDQIVFRAGLRFAATRRITFSAIGTTNIYHYGSSHPDAHFLENTLQLSASASF